MEKIVVTFNRIDFSVIQRISRVELDHVNEYMNDSMYVCMYEFMNEWIRDMMI